MTVVFAILYLLVHVLILVVLGRFAVDMIQSFARGWRPQGASLVLASSIYAVTDPILNPLRRDRPGSVVDDPHLRAGHPREHLHLPAGVGLRSSGSRRRSSALR